MVFGKRVVEEIKLAETKIWVCTSDSCKGWVRDNFRSGGQTTCPLCQSEMEMEIKELQICQNHSHTG